jgi:threonine aldolase
MSLSCVDLRANTFTKPRYEMRGTIFNAESGDDAYSSDPPVSKLQEMAASLLGKEAAGVGGGWWVVGGG